jgi:hypothetical protein
MIVLALAGLLSLVSIATLAALPVVVWKLVMARPHGGAYVRPAPRRSVAPPPPPKPLPYCLQCDATPCNLVGVPVIRLRRDPLALRAWPPLPADGLPF